MKKKLRIGIISQAYFPIHGGLSEHVFHTAHELVDRGHDVRIITAYFDRGDEQWDWDGRVIRIGRDITVPINGAFVNVTFAVHIKRELRQIERRHKFDIVHIHQPWDPILPLAACGAIEAPKVGTFHTFTGRRAYFANFMHRLIAGNVDRLSARIAVSEPALSLAAATVKGDIRVIPNGVSLKRFSPDLPPIEKFNDGKKNVLFIGRMDPRKGLKYLLKAWPAIARDVPDSRLIIVGGGVLKEYYRRVYVRDGSDRIFWEGYATNEDLPRYYASADVVCIPSTKGESFGIVLLEAMASGAPIVASDIDGYSSVVRNNQEAILVQPRDPQALSRAVIQLLQNTELHQRLQRQGLERVQKFSWQRVTDQIEAVYFDVIESAS